MLLQLIFCLVGELKIVHLLSCAALVLIVISMRLASLQGKSVISVNCNVYFSFSYVTITIF